MGGSYYVPRSVKGETRILYMFTIKSFIVTLVFALLGWAVTLLVGQIVKLAIMPTLVIILIFGAIGYALATLTIPDVPAMGKLRKAGGENIGSMLIRAMTFNKKKRIYLYNYKREINKGGDINAK